MSARYATIPKRKLSRTAVSPIRAMMRRIASRVWSIDACIEIVVSMTKTTPPRKSRNRAGSAWAGAWRSSAGAEITSSIRICEPSRRWMVSASRIGSR